MGLGIALQLVKGFNPTDIGGYIVPVGAITGPFTAYFVMEAVDARVYMDGNSFCLHQHSEWEYQGEVLVRIRREEGRQITLQAIMLQEHSLTGPDDTPFEPGTVKCAISYVFNRYLLEDEDRQVRAFIREMHEAVL